VIRNKAKIEATVHNAQQVLDLVDSYGSIHTYFASFRDGTRPPRTCGGV
jgi:3-methyladenine DNA glycosylase Tag